MLMYYNYQDMCSYHIIYGNRVKNFSFMPHILLFCRGVLLNLKKYPVSFKSGLARRVTDEISVGLTKFWSIYVILCSIQYFGFK